MVVYKQLIQFEPLRYFKNIKKFHRPQTFSCNVYFDAH